MNFQFQKTSILNLNRSEKSETKVNIALETMAGKGTEIGRSFEELAAIIDKVEANERLTVCLDTCHIHDAGYHVSDGFDDVLNEFDKIVGVDRIKVVHVNDSKNERGAQKDRHENIGFGHVGFDALHYVIFHEEFKNIPKILETPYVGVDKKNKRPPYKYEIEMIKSGNFDEKLLDKIMQ